MSLLTLVLTAALSQTPQPRMIPAEAIDVVGRSAPSFELPMLEGGTFDLEDKRGGKTIILSFWASWCGPCRLELPALDKLMKERDDIEVYAVNVDREQSQARRFLASVPFDLPIIWDKDSVALGQYEVLSMPTMFVLDPNLTIKWRKTGYSQQNGLEELIDHLDGKE